jgi:hypothetical protein
MLQFVWSLGGPRCIVALALIAGLASPDRALGDPYTVSGIKVTASDPRPEEARAKAVAEGEQLAFERLLRRFTLAEDFVRLPKPTAEVIRTAVRNFSIESELGRGGRYTATIGYQFDREAVRAFLEQAKVPFLDTPSPPLVVLPVWIEKGKKYLWDDPNPWREAWSRNEADDSIVDFVRLRGDLDDLRAISADEAESANRLALGRIGERYRAGLIVVAVAALEKGRRRIAVQMHDLANGQTTILSEIAAGEDAAALDKAAAELARALDAAWKRSAVAVERNATVARIRAPLEGLEHWIRIRQALQSLSQSRGFDTISMSATEAVIELRFAGTLAELKHQLEQKGLGLTPDPSVKGSQVWILRATGIRETDLAPTPGTPPRPDADKTGPQKKP